MSKCERESGNRFRKYLYGAIVALVTLGILSSCGPPKREVQPNKRGERGETCRASNDCQGDLACINETCVKNEYDIEPNAKVCKIIECKKRDDCCELSEVCRRLKEGCEEEQSTFDCESYEDQGCGDCQDNSCTEACDQKCQNNKCVRDLSCSDDSDCRLGESCDDSTCVECEDDSECQSDQTCRNGQCRDTCTIDENCPMFHKCNDMGKCVETGCNSDRECVLFLDDGDAKCKNGECREPCSSDAECNRGRTGGFYVCDDESGLCKFAGCKSDRECRIQLDLENTDTQAACKSQNGGN